MFMFIYINLVFDLLQNYLQGGALLPVISYPGFHMMVPFLTTYKSVQVSKYLILILYTLTVTCNACLHFYKCMCFSTNDSLLF